MSKCQLHVDFNYFPSYKETTDGRMGCIP